MAIEVKFGEKVRATCRFDYSGPPGPFTFAQEIGTWLPPVFNTLDRWEEQVSVTPGTAMTHTMVFTISKVSGLRAGVTYDMNFEIGTGSQGDGTWKLVKREITDDVISIIEEAIPQFSNLSVTYSKM